MFDLKVKLTRTGIDLDGLDERVRIAVQKKFEYLADLLFDKVMENVTGRILQSKSGQLAESIKKEVHAEANPMYAIVGPKPATPKAWALEKGGREDYPIFPIKAMALHFFWEKMGEEVFMSYVPEHPPASPYRYLGRAYETVRRQAPQAMKDAIEEAMRSKTL